MRARHVTLAALLGLDAVLLAWALFSGSRDMREGTSYVTDGWIVAGGIAATFVLAWLVRFLPVGEPMRAWGRVLLMGAQAVHALGHLANLYHDLWWYDDALHVGLVGVGAVLLWLALRERAPGPASWRPILAAITIVTIALALASAWELLEYGADRAFGTREQDNLVDTMQDTLDGAAGGLLGAIILRTRAWFSRSATQRNQQRHERA